VAHVIYQVGEADSVASVQFAHAVYVVGDAVEKARSQVVHDVYLAGEANVEASVQVAHVIFLLVIQVLRLVSKWLMLSTWLMRQM
jgi:hypothetical protein